MAGRRSWTTDAFSSFDDYRARFGGLFRWVAASVVVAMGWGGATSIEATAQESRGTAETTTNTATPSAGARTVGEELRLPLDLEVGDRLGFRLTMDHRQETHLGVKRAARQDRKMVRDWTLEVVARATSGIEFRAQLDRVSATLPTPKGPVTLDTARKTEPSDAVLAAILNDLRLSLTVVHRFRVRDRVIEPPASSKSAKTAAATLPAEIVRLFRDRPPVRIPREGSWRQPREMQVGGAVVKSDVVSSVTKADDEIVAISGQSPLRLEIDPAASSVTRGIRPGTRLEDGRIEVTATYALGAKMDGLPQTARQIVEWRFVVPGPSKDDEPLVTRARIVHDVERRAPATKDGSMTKPSKPESDDASKSSRPSKLPKSSKSSRRSRR